MRRARRTDANQSAIVKSLRAAGCVVEVTSDVGRGFPDLVVRTPRGTVMLVEIKDGSLPPSRRALTPDELAFSKRWGVSYAVVETEGQALLLANTT